MLYPTAKCSKVPLEAMIDLADRYNSLPVSPPCLNGRWHSSPVSHYSLGVKGRDTKNNEDVARPLIVQTAGVDEDNMRLGLQVNNFTWPGGPATLGADLIRVAQNAEAAGFDSFWVMDHFFQLGPVGHGVTDQPMLEAYTTLGFVAGVTSKMMLGTMVTGVTYRHPGILVKEVTTLDVLSGGRAYLGIGAAWFEEEHRALGVEFPPVKERFERLEEALRIAHQMWQDGGNFDEAQPFEGKHYHLTRTLNVPQALQRPHPPILIGGTGEQKTLRMVAQYGDACNLFARLGDEALQHKLDVLRGHCEKLGRPYSDIEKTSLDSVNVTRDGSNGTLTPQQALDQFKHLADMGFDHALVSFRNVAAPDAFEIWAELAPQIHAIPVAGR
jgi:F420-dependent oxidoreductase-like protein